MNTCLRGCRVCGIQWIIGWFSILCTVFKMTLMFWCLTQGPCYINFDRFPADHSKAEEEFSGWDREFWEDLTITAPEAKSCWLIFWGCFCQNKGVKTVKWNCRLWFASVKRHSREGEKVRNIHSSLSVAIERNKSCWQRKKTNKKKRVWRC